MPEIHFARLIYFTFSRTLLILCGLALITSILSVCAGYLYQKKPNN